MTELQLEAARIPDRDRLLRELRDNGVEAHKDGEVGIKVPCSDGGESALGDDLYFHVESVVMDIGAPFVPIRHDGVIYLRPPLS